MSHAVADGAEVLFVGNSFTHGESEPVLSYNRGNITDLNGSGYGGVPAIFKKLCEQFGINCNVAIEAVGGQTLEFHFENKAAQIKSRRWDAVVLQEQSTLPLPQTHGGKPNEFFRGADDLHDLVLAGNPSAKVFLYETWSSPTTITTHHYVSLAEMQSDLHAGYTNAAARAARSPAAANVTGVAHVGDAFMRTIAAGAAVADPAKGVPAGKFDLWGPDHRHASKYGSYLAALVLLKELTGRDPRSIGSGPNSAASDLGISAADAQRLQEIAAAGSSAMTSSPTPAPTR